ncbi:MAG: hypothetical protein ACOCWO_05540 [Candidatus Muiribacteriaceae bacterium]
MKKKNLLFLIVMVLLLAGGIFLKEPDIIQRVGSFICYGCIGF